jgi:hypothetical protein
MGWHWRCKKDEKFIADFGFLTTDGHEIYTDGFDSLDRRESKRSI